MCNQRVQYYGEEVQKRQSIQIKNVVLASCAANLPPITHTCPLGIMNFQPNSGPWSKQSQLTAVSVMHVKIT